MPILIAIGVAAVVVAVVLTLVARQRRTSDPADVREGAAEIVEQAHRHPALRRFLTDRRDTTKATGWLLTIALGVIAGLTLVIGLVLEMVQTHAGFARWDNSAARWGAAHTTGAAEVRGPRGHAVGQHRRGRPGLRRRGRRSSTDAFPRGPFRHSWPPW